MAYYNSMIIHYHSTTSQTTYSVLTSLVIHLSTCLLYTSQRLRDQGSDVQIIFLTAYSEFDYARDALRLYAADYILKPFEDGTIETSVQKIIPKLTKTKTPQAINDTNRYVKKAIEYIEQNYANPNLSIYDIATYLEISEGHISRLFHKETNYTLAGYITSCLLYTSRCV